VRGVRRRVPAAAGPARPPRRRRTTASAAVAILATVLVATGATCSGTSRPSAVPAPKPVSVARGRYVGVAAASLAGFGAASGVKANLAPRYLAWGTPLPVPQIEASKALGATTLIELLPYGVSLRSIVDDAHNAYLTSLGRAIAALHERVWLSFAPEANGRNYTWGYKHVTPTLYKEAYRHVWNLVTAAGATDVDWVWQVSHSYPGTETPVSVLYPGAKYVTTVGIDGYLYYRTDTFTSTFSTALSAIRKVTKAPVLLSETAIGPEYHRYGAGQSQMMQALFAGMEKNKFIGLVWFDKDQYDPPVHQMWELKPGSAGMQAFSKYAIAFARG
jgi:hypothetical protein